MIELPSRYQPGDTVVLHVEPGSNIGSFNSGKREWINECTVQAVKFTCDGHVLYDLRVPVKSGYLLLDNTPSQWVVARMFDINPMATELDVLQVKKANDA